MGWNPIIKTSPKEKLESYFREHIRDPEKFKWVITTDESEILTVEFLEWEEPCFSWKFLNGVHEIFPYRAIIAIKGRFRFV